MLVHPYRFQSICFGFGSPAKASHLKVSNWTVRRQEGSPRKGNHKCS